MGMAALDFSYESESLAFGLLPFWFLVPEVTIWPLLCSFSINETTIHFLLGKNLRYICTLTISHLMLDF